jgi:hypothetical protein
MPQFEGRPKDASAYTDRPDKRGWVVFTLSPWREVGGRWIRRPVYVDFIVPTHRSAKRVLAKFRFSSIVIRFAARRRKNGRLTGKLPITEIDVKVEVPPRPKPIDDAFLGRLKYDDGLEKYVAYPKLAVGSPEVVVATSMTGDAGAILARCLRGMKPLLDAVTRKMLPLYNKTWREGPDLQPPAFRARVTRLSEVEIDKRRTVLRFDAGDLFGDHAIEVRLASTGKVTGISLA